MIIKRYKGKHRCHLRPSFARPNRAAGLCPGPGDTVLDAAQDGGKTVGKLLGNGEIMGKSWGNPGEIMGKSWGNHGEIMGKSWGNHGEILGKSWGNHGEILGKSWGNHGEIMGKSWGTHGEIMGKYQGCSQYIASLHSARFHLKKTAGM